MNFWSREALYFRIFPWAEKYDLKISDIITKALLRKEGLLPIQSEMQ